MENHPCEKFPQKNYNERDTLHNNRRRSELSMALEEEEEEERIIKAPASCESESPI